MAQAAHGSAPDIAGRNIANPYAMIMSAQMMLEWLGRKRGDDRILQTAALIEKACYDVIENRRCLTPDLGGRAGTTDMGEAVVAALDRVLPKTA
jgi:3-isopropylmalate dehydrogenase